MQPLNADQRTRVERLARSQGEKCSQCQSSDYLSCGDEYPRKTTGGVLVYLDCNNLEAHPDGVNQYFTISEDDARAIGIPI
jgi:hypothetical protein